MPRVIIAMMDSFGIGGAPDAADYFNDGRPDTGANTFLHIAEACAAGKGDRAGLRAGPLNLQTLDKLGLGAAGKLSSGVLAPGFSEGSAGFWAVGREVSRARIPRPAIGKLPACRCPLTGAISRKRNPVSQTS